MSKKLFAVFVSVFIAVCLFSCTQEEIPFEEITSEEISKIAGPLIEKSYEINEMYFGCGLPIDEKSLESYNGKLQEDIDVKSSYYLAVDSEYKYQTTLEMKEATLEVYSTDYCESSIFPVAFEGIINENGDILEYASFIVNEVGILTERHDIAQRDPLPKRTYDLDSVKSISQSADTIVFSVDSYVDGAVSDNIRLTIKKQDSGWRLDTPTY